MTRVTVNDIRKAGYCVSGVRRWAEIYGFDLRDFLKNGIEADLLRATGDEFGQRIADIAEESDG